MAWLTVTAGEPPPTCTVTGLRSVSWARRLISSGMVAEKRRVCRSLGSRLSIFLISGKSPCQTCGLPHREPELLPGEVDGSLSDMVEQTTGTGNNNLCALSQFLNLRVNVYSAVNGNAPKAGLASEGLNGLMYLLRQFARGGDDERPHIAAATLHQTVQYRQCKCGGLACAGLGNAHDVPPLHYSWYRLRLDRSRRNISCRCYSGLHGGIEVKLFKIHNLLLSCSKKKSPRVIPGPTFLSRFLPGTAN